MAPRRPDLQQLGKRARQVLDALYRRGPLSAADVLAEVPDLPSYSAARAALRVLEDKGFVTHVSEHGRYIYRPSVPSRQARRSAMRHLVNVLFRGSAAEAMVALADLSRGKLEDEEVETLRRLIADAEATPGRRRRRGQP